VTRKFVKLEEETESENAKSKSGSRFAVDALAAWTGWPELKWPAAPPLGLHVPRGKNVYVNYLSTYGPVSYLGEYAMQISRSCLLPRR
jgi:hypothetical protein